MSEEKIYYTQRGVTADGLEALSENFHPAQVEWRAQTINTDNMWALLVPYVTARAVQARFDKYCGPANWKSVYREIKSHEPDKKGVMREVVNMLCGISIKCDCGETSEWVTKFDGAPPTDIEGFKGSISVSFRRAAVSWGPGRSLYDLEPEFVDISTTKDNTKEKTRYNGKWYFYAKPKLPKWMSDCEDDADGDPTVDDELVSVCKQVNLEAETWEALLEKMKREDCIAFGKTANGANLMDGVKQRIDRKVPAKDICKPLVKYFQMEEK